jgi:hypothetical protein|tara:strand:- start:41 stop:337 length:297 start_codon:yes stop_codon:yes gene_type:complete
MIDTDRYEGHTEGPWKVIEKANDYQTTDVVVGKTIVASNVSPSDSALIADAPLLLEEVERLREGIQNALYLFQEAGNPKMSDKKRLDTICDALLEVIE